jgi:hypothetical protein
VVIDGTLFHKEKGRMLSGGSNQDFRVGEVDAMITALNPPASTDPRSKAILATAAWPPMGKAWSAGDGILSR